MSEDSEVQPANIVDFPAKPCAAGERCRNGGTIPHKTGETLREYRCRLWCDALCMKQAILYDEIASKVRVEESSD